MSEPRIPEGLANHYRWQKGALVRRDLADAWIGRTMFVFCVLSALVAVGAGYAGYGLAALFAGSMTPAFLVFGAMNLLDREDLPHRLDRDGLTVRGRGVIRYQRIHLTGELGTRLRLVVSGQGEQVVLVDGFPTPPWSIEGVLWFTEQLERLGGVERRSDVDVEAWRSWAENPKERHRMALERRLGQSRKAFPELHALEPVEPDDAEISMEQLSWRGVLLDPDDVHGERTASLEAVREVQVVIESRATLLVRTADGLVPILSVSTEPDEVAQLHWLAERVRAAAAQAEPDDHGDVDDVPASLRTLRQRE